jgi:lambda family phage tail tape measure protein
LAAKKAAESAATSTKHWQDQVTSLNDTLAKQHDELAAQLDSTTKLTPAQNLLAQILGGSNEAYNHATAAIQKKILAEAQDNAQLSLQVAAQEQQRKSLELTAALQDKLNERIAARTDQNAIDVAGVGHGQELTQQLQDELKIRQDYAKQVDDLNKQANNPSNLGTTNGIGGDDYNSRLAMISAGQQQELAIYRAGVQQRLAAESDWSNGARASFEDYIANAANVAGQTQTMFTNAFQGMEDALVTFATTGKLSFTSLANGIISDLARMQVKIIESQALQALLNAFSPGAGAFSSLGGSSSSYSSINNGQFSGGFDLASGRAAGGSVSPKQMYEVAEHGKPELLQSGGRTYLMTGQGGGTVTPATKNVSPGSTGGGGMNVTFAVDIQNNTTAKVSTKQSTGSDGMPKMSVFIDQIDEAMAGRVTNGTSKTARAIGARSGTNMNGTL